MISLPVFRSVFLRAFGVSLWLTFVCVLSLSFSLPALAQQPPEKPLRPQALEDVQKALATEQQKTLDLARQVTQARNGLNQTREKLVTLGQDVGQNETRIRDIDARIGALSAEETTLKARLDQDEGSLSDLVLALERLRRVPPESTILRPGVPLDQARSAMILRGVLPDIRKRAAALRADLDRLTAIRSELEANRALVSAENARLEATYAKMNALLKERESLYGQTRQAHEDQTRTVAVMSEKARSLTDLLARIKREEKDRRTRMETARRDSPKQTMAKVDLPLPDVGVARIPVSGSVRIRYGEKNDMGARSEGVTIEGRAGSVVVAPMGGIVRYAGSFKRFGNIVIIEHQKGFHSLLAGLGKIDTVVGRSLSAGEPVGFLLPPDQGGKASLYYELRLDGNPVDPSGKLADLG